MGNRPRPPGPELPGWSGHVRLSGVHAFLGAISEGELGPEAEDGGQSVHAGGQDDLPMVPAASPRSDRRTTRGTMSEAPRARGVLRDHGQQSVALAILPRGAQVMAEVADAAAACVACLMELVPPTSGALPGAVLANSPLDVPRRSEGII